MEVLKSKLDETQLQLRELKNRLRQNICERDHAAAEADLRSLIEQPSHCLPFPSERPMPGFQFNLTTIATAIELGKRVGFRAAADAMQIVFDMLEIDMRVPSHDAIEQWTLRLGQSWKKEDVEREYLKLAKQIGSPVYLLCDGATELRDAAQKLEKNGEKTIVLDQFAPPTLRSKSRFMNLGSLFNWATMVLYHLNTPGSQSRSEISDGRMEQKLGWLREYANDLVGWNACQNVIDDSLLVINQHGLDAHTAVLLEQALSEANSNWRNEDCSATRIGVQLSDWINQSFKKLHADERAWLSTEILESLFGKFKQLERQQSKGGFTRLIAAIPTLCQRVTREIVRASFQRVDSKALKKWIQDSLGTTLTARRNAAYRESRSKTCDHTISPA